MIDFSNNRNRGKRILVENMLIFFELNVPENSSHNEDSSHRDVEISSWQAKRPMYSI